MTLTSPAVGRADPKDTKILSRIQKRLRVAFGKMGTWRNVADIYGVNHGYVSMVMHGSIPTNAKVRAALGFPATLPSERKPRVKKSDPPRVWEDGWEDVYLKKIKRTK